MIFNDLINLISNYIFVEPIILRIILALLFIILGLILSHIFSKYIIKLLITLANRTKSNFDDLLINAIERPARVLIIGLSIWVGISIFNLPVLFQSFLTRALRTYILVIVFWFLYRAAHSITFIFERYLNKTGKKASPVLLSVFRKSLKFIIVLLEVFMIIREWGYDISGLIAGLGVGGLAFSLAAKDAASNLLGSITIMLDKTYSVGDWIEADTIEGVVEEIGFRSTKIRTFADSLISVPNSIMSNEPVTNWSKMGKRRVNYNLQIPLYTPAEKIESLLTKIRDMINNHDDVNKDFIVVNLNGFGEAALQIVIYYFTKTTSWASYTKVNADINLKILKIFEETNVSIIPPRSMMVQNTQMTNL